MMLNQISDLVNKIREELNLTRGVVPRIESVYEYNDSSLHVVTSDRAEKKSLGSIWNSSNL